MILRNLDMSWSLGFRLQSIARICSNEHRASFSPGGTGIRTYSMKKPDVHKRCQLDVREEFAWTQPAERGTVKIRTSSTESGEGSSSGFVSRDLDRDEILNAGVLYHPPDHSLSREVLASENGSSS